MADEFKPNWCLPPGAILFEEMKARGATVRSIAVNAPFTLNYVSGVLDAHEPVTEEFANRLEQMWGTPASFWLRLESLWQEHRAGIDEEVATDG